MPDHLHLIMEGDSEKSDLWEMMILFKQKTGFWLSQNTMGMRWQKERANERTKDRINWFSGYGEEPRP